MGRNALPLRMKHGIITRLSKNFPLTKTNLRRECDRAYLRVLVNRQYRSIYPEMFINLSTLQTITLSQYNAIRAKLEKEQKWCREKLNPNKNYISDYTQGRISGLEMAIQIVSRFIELEKEQA